MNIFKNRLGVYYFRCKVPKDIVADSSVKNIYLSLRTKSPNQANLLGQEVRTYVDQFFNFVRQNGLALSRKRVPSGDDVMFNLTASLAFRDSEITIKSQDLSMFNQLVTSMQAIQSQFERAEQILVPQVVPQTVQQIAAPTVLPTLPATTVNTLEDGRPAIEVYDEYCQGIGENLSPLSLRGRSSFKLYVGVLFGDRPLNTIDRTVVHEIKNNIYRIPIYLYNKDFYAEKKGLSDIREGMKPITHGTAERLFSMIIAFFNWCVAKGYKENNPFNGQKLFVEKKREKVETYNKSDFDILFDKTNFERFCERFGSRYWITLISLYTGARKGEIVGLDMADVIIDKNGQYYLYVRKETTVKNKVKLVKNSHSIRLIPIPDILMKLGFADYVNTIKAEGYPVLFPDCRIKENGMTDSDAITLAWLKYRQDCKIEGHKTFHSLRHNTVSCLKHKKCLLSDIQELIGHSYGNITFDVYGEPSDISDIVNLVNKVDYGIEHHPWQDTELKRKIRAKAWAKTVEALKL